MDGYIASRKQLYAASKSVRSSPPRRRVVHARRVRTYVLGDGINLTGVCRHACVLYRAPGDAEVFASIWLYGALFAQRLTDREREPLRTRLCISLGKEAKLLPRETGQLTSEQGGHITCSESDQITRRPKEWMVASRSGPVPVLPSAIIEHVLLLWLVVNDRKFLAGTVFFSHTN